MRVSVALTAAFAFLAVAGCSGGGESGNVQGDTVPGSGDTSQPTSAWEKFEDKDEFTDKVTKWYKAGDELRLACSSGGNVNLYLGFPSASVDPSIAMGLSDASAKIRIDSGVPFEEKWTVWLNDGSATPADNAAFQNKLKGAQKLVIELFPDAPWAIRKAVDVTGFDAALADMQSTGCPKSEG